MLRLALAIREADGDHLVGEEALDDLPHFADAVAEILRRAGLLRPRPAHRPAVTTPQPRSCRHCGSWGFRTLCQGCRHWSIEHQAGTCRRCRRAALPVGDGDGLCRGCRLHVAEHGPHALAEPWTQLWFGGTLSLTLRAASRSLGYRPLGRRARLRLQAQRSARLVSTHLVDPNQGTLVAVPRDWRRVDAKDLPALTPAAEQLLEAFKQRSRTQAWDDGIGGQATRALHLLLAWLGADAPIPEADIRSIPMARPWTSSRRVLRFLEEHDLVVPDPARQVDVDQHAIDQRLQTLPDGIAGELRRWVQVLRGEGRRQHRPMAFSTIRKYVGYADPVVQAWAARLESLREITPDDIRVVLRDRQGNQARSVHVALRSLFRALKQERLVFRDPTRGISLTKVEHLPAPLPSDRLRGLLEEADGAMARLAVALVAIHALRKTELTHLHLADLDLARGRLTIRRGMGRHIVYLDEFTHGLAVAWLCERQRRWPRTANPYLLVSQQTAVDPGHPPATLAVIDRCFRPLGMSPSQLRADRILDEARHTADPVRLMRVFGISDTTAMKYLYTAHPERQSVPPR
jgi:integrase